MRNILAILLGLLLLGIVLAGPSALWFVWREEEPESESVSVIQCDLPRVCV